jgi:hypothetical protein
MAINLYGYLAKPIIVYPAFVLQHMTSIKATNNTKKKIADIKNKLVRNTKGMSPLSVAVMLPVLAYECSGYIDDSIVFNGLDVL